jgi:hypothetical protein
MRWIRMCDVWMDVWMATEGRTDRRWLLPPNFYGQTKGAHTRSTDRHEFTDRHNHGGIIKVLSDIDFEVLANSPAKTNKYATCSRRCSFFDLRRWVAGAEKLIEEASITHRPTRQ